VLNKVEGFPLKVSGFVILRRDVRIHSSLGCWSCRARSTPFASSHIMSGVEIVGAAFWRARASGIIGRVAKVALTEGPREVPRRILGATRVGLLPWSPPAQVAVVAGKAGVGVAPSVA